MRMSDWSADVGSSDVIFRGGGAFQHTARHGELLKVPGNMLGGGDAFRHRQTGRDTVDEHIVAAKFRRARPRHRKDGALARVIIDRKSVVEGKRVSVRVGLGGGSIINTKTETED